MLKCVYIGLATRKMLGLVLVAGMVFVWQAPLMHAAPPEPKAAHSNPKQVKSRKPKNQKPEIQQPESLPADPGSTVNLDAGKPPPCPGVTLEAIETAYAAIKSFKGRFTQDDRLATGQVVTAGGEIAYQKPGRMRWAYDPPDEQLLLTDGDTVWLVDPMLDNVTIQSLKGLAQGSPLAFLVGMGKLSQDFTCRPLTLPPPEDGLTYVELISKNPLPTVDYIQLGVTSRAELKTILVVDLAGNIRKVQLQHTKKGVAFPRGYFVFEVEEGMEVISR